MTEPNKHEQVDRLLAAYEKMLEHTRAGIERAQESAPRLRDWIDEASNHMIELGELTREEAQRIANYIERDIHDAAEHIKDTGEDLRSWWRFDLDLIEQRLLDAFSHVADQTSVQLQQWAAQARGVTRYHSGEITGPGTLVCEQCGYKLHFTTTTQIPACPECAATTFKRAPRD